MDNTVPPEVEELAARTTAFVRDVVIPVELQVAGVMHDAPDDLRRSLQKQARDAGLLAPHVCRRSGGSRARRTRLCRRLRGGRLQPARSAGPQLCRTRRGQHAPARGGRHAGAAGAVPGAAGARRGPLGFAMTEPAPGAGSDPSALLTSAERDGDRWVINGRKWFITGAEGPPSTSAWPAPARSAAATGRPCSSSTPPTPASR